MGTKTLLSECFLNRGFTLLQWLLNLVLQIPHFTLNINRQCNTAPKKYLIMIICIYLFLQPTTTFLSCDHVPPVVHHSFTIQSQLSFLRSETHEAELWFGMTDESQSQDKGAVQPCGHQHAPLCLARPAVTPQPSSDCLLTERLFLITQASLSVFSSFSAWLDGRSHIVYSAGHAKGISAVDTARTAALMCSSYQNIWPEWAMTPSLSCIKCPT